jgi:uncharacterized protein (TIGR02246 family)
MRHAASCLIVLCLWTAPAFSQSAPASPVPASTVLVAGPDAQAIRQIEDEWLKAERATDPAALDRILADDFVNLSTTGLAPGKAQILMNFHVHAGQPPAYTVETSDMRIYIFGDTAVAAFSKTYTAKENGNIAHEAMTHVYTKDHGVWKLRLSRSSIL